MPPDVFSRLLDAFPFLRTAPEAVTEAVRTHGQPVTLEAEAFICMEGDACSFLALVLDGHARVFKTSDSGRELTLYRVGRGESCILTASCILSDRAFPAFAMAESAVEAVAVPAWRVREWVQTQPVWQTYIFGLMAQRFDEVLGVVEDVTFRRLDARLADHLLTLSGGTAADIPTTHETLASDLGSSREVISRVLKELEHQGAVQLSRGHVRIEAPEQLRHLAEKT